MKRFLIALMLLCGLPALAVDTTIGNLGAITTVPDNYKAVFENPGVVDYGITFQNLTNQVLNGYASQAYAQGLTNGYPWTNVSYVQAQGITNGYPWTNVTYIQAQGITNGYPWTNVSYIQAQGITNGYPWTNITSGVQLNGTNVWTGTNTFGPQVTCSNKVIALGVGSVIPQFSVGGDTTGVGAEVAGMIDIISSGVGIARFRKNYGWINNRANVIHTSLQSSSIAFANTGVSGTIDTAIDNPSAGLITIWTNLTAAGTLAATNGVVQMLKPSFTTNFTCTTNLQYYCCNGTNQIVTLPNAAYVPNVVYRFGMTNGWAKVIITNATGAQTIRDGSSLSYTQVGVGNPTFISDGAHWWPASKTKVVFPNAQFSCTTNINVTTAGVSYPVTFDTTDFDYSQGIVLAAGTNGLNSKMWITNSGQYEFSPSMMVQLAANGHNFKFWFKSNGTNMPNSSSALQGSAGDIRLATVVYRVNVTEPTAYEIWAQFTGGGAGPDIILAQAAGGVAPNDYPASPSIICPVKRISDLWP